METGRPGAGEGRAIPNPIITLDSADDPRVTDYRSLTDAALRRRQDLVHGMYMAESSQVVRRAVDAGHRPRSFFMEHRHLDGLADVVAQWPQAPVYVGEQQVLQDITGFHLHRGALAAMHRPPELALDEVLAGIESRAGEGRIRIGVLEDLTDHTNVGGHKPPQESDGSSIPSQPSPESIPEAVVDDTFRAAPRRRIAILEDLTDHTNVGACFRSAAALGIDALLLSPRCADPLYRRAIRVSMGGVFQVPWTRIDPWPEGIEQLQNAGYLVAGMSLGEGSVALDDLVAQDLSKLALVFGNEGDGLRPETDQRLDMRVTIPMMPGVDSLNVAASSAVTFYATR